MSGQQRLPVRIVEVDSAHALAAQNRAPDAKNRTVLLDAAEKVMLEHGYAAVSSRRVAEQAGLKPQLVHYYFVNMDELLAEVFRRRAEQGLEFQAKALASPPAAVGVVAVQQQPGRRRTDDGIHSDVAAPARAAETARRLFRAVPPRPGRGDRDTPGTVRRCARGLSARRRIGSHDQPVPGRSDGGGSRLHPGSRRNHRARGTMARCRRRGGVGGKPRA